MIYIIKVVSDRSGSKAAILAHIDTIGMMVRDINSDGTQEVCPIGGLCPVFEVNGDVVIHSLGGQNFTGTIQRKNSSTHLMNSTEIFLVDPSDCIVRLDEPVFSRSDTSALGIRVGDMIAPVPRFQYRKDGYMKSRFLDDKASAAALLTMIHDIAKNQTAIRKTDFYFTAFAETGRGTSLLRCARGVHILPYDRQGKRVSWETSGIRRWVNDTFFQTAFTASEQSAVVESRLRNVSEVTEPPPAIHYTNDRAFLLSEDEVRSFGKPKWFWECHPVQPLAGRTAGV